MMIDSKSKDKKKSTSLNSRNVVIVSIAEFLEANGFKKSLSKFRSESKLESDSKVLGVNLEELVCKYLESSCSNEEKAVHGNENVLPSNEETSTKVSKKKENTSTDITAEVELERNVEVKEKKKKVKKSLPVSVEESTAEDSVEAEEKKKKKETKSEPALNSEVNAIEKKSKKHKATADKCNGDTETVEADEKHEGKKKKKNKADAAVDKLTQNKNEVSKVDASGDDDDTEKESHKKRKRSEFDSNKAESLTGEDDPCTAKKIKSEKSAENSNLSNGKTENGALGGHTASKSRKKEKQSHEPKTVNAFQRVKIEEVKFVDERLQDNSYWALDETGSGYGAKAQEVLGQVRGRDFRHEKTKKKRGSYRGGQIDLNSHSVKFNYSDEE